MHRRARVGLGHHQHRQGARARARAFGGNAAKLADDFSAAVSRSTPRPLPGTRRSPSSPCSVTRSWLPVAEQRQVLVGQPLQEGAALGDQRRQQRRRRGIELGDRLLQARDHRLPVLDGGAHVAEHALDARHQLAALLRVDQTVDLDVHPRFARRASGASRRGRMDASRPPASRSTAKIGCTIRCSVSPAG